MIIVGNSMTKLIVANWKMNGSISKVQHDINTYLTSKVTNQSNVIIALPNVFLAEAAKIITDSNASMSLSSQDVSQFDGFGAYTGEISATMLKDLNVQYTIIGHSERRLHLGEETITLAKKITHAINNQIKPIFCIGEPINLRENGVYNEFLLDQLECLKLVSCEIKDIIIAYEPIWSIGSGLVPSVKEVESAMLLVHKFMQNNFPHVKIATLYGGSVSSKNATEILNIPSVGGVLVGGASLKVDEFTIICGSC